MSTLSQIVPVSSSTIGGATIQTANARDLHAYLGLGKDFSNWVKAQIARARLIEGRNYVSSPSRASSGQPDEIRTLGFSTPRGGAPEKVTLLARSARLDFCKASANEIRTHKIAPNSKRTPAEGGEA